MFPKSTVNFCFVADLSMFYQLYYALTDLEILKEEAAWTMASVEPVYSRGKNCLSSAWQMARGCHGKGNTVIIIIIIWFRNLHQFSMRDSCWGWNLRLQVQFPGVLAPFYFLNSKFRETYHKERIIFYFDVSSFTRQLCQEVQVMLQLIWIHCCYYQKKKKLTEICCL